MIITARLNNDDSKTYYLVSWDSQDFANSTTLKVQGNELGKVSADFSQITKLEVFQDGNLVATYTDLDSFTEVSFLKNEYCPGESKFCDAFRIHLTKVDIIAQVQRLDEQINPTVDLDKMTLAEVKEWKVKELGDVCRAEISEGTMVVFPDGTQEYFTDDSDDEINLTNAAFLAFVGKSLGFDLDYIPYHSSGHMCNNYTFSQIMIIYMTLQLRLTRLTTKCNMLNCMIRACDNKEDVLAINWDTTLPAEYQERYDEIMTAAVAIAEAMAHAMAPEIDPEPEENTDPEDETPSEEEPTE